MKGLINLAIFAFLGGGGWFVWTASRAPKTTFYMHVVQPEPVLFVDFGFTVWRIIASVAAFSVCAVLLAGAWWAISKARNADRYIAHEGGLMPGIRMNTATLWERLRGINQITVVNPNNVGTVDATVRVWRDGTRVLGGRADWTAEHQERIATGVNRIQTEAARAFGNVGGNRGPNQAELLDKAGYFDQRTEAERLKVEAARAKLMGEPEAEEEPHAEPLPPVDWRGALMQSTANSFVIGQNEETGALAEFRPREAIHCGVIGATGTGKTASTGMLMALQALRTGYHVVILDPKGGADWRVFQQHAEWQHADSTTICDQIATITDEHDRRHSILRASNAPNVMALPQPPQPIMVFVEEYGDLYAQVRSASKKDSDHLEEMLARMMRLARFTDIHFVFLDQYPEHWSQQLIGNCKLLVTYKLGPNQGAKVGEYHAHKLPNLGTFSIQGTWYKAWFVQPETESTLRRLPEPKEPPLLPEFVQVREPGGGRVYAQNAPTPPPHTNHEPARTTRLDRHEPDTNQHELWGELGTNQVREFVDRSSWREPAFGWLSERRETGELYRQIDLATWMAQIINDTDDPDRKQIAAMKSTAKKYHDEWSEEHGE